MWRFFSFLRFLAGVLEHRMLKPNPKRPSAEDAMKIGVLINDTTTS
jgi:hypothetical protein